MQSNIVPSSGGSMHGQPPKRRCGSYLPPRPGPAWPKRPPPGLRSAVALVYLLYLGMLAWLAWHRMGQLWPALVVPASAFVVGTLVRKLIDRPRPYTALGFTPLFPKDKTGQSMPSRHCFSAAAIAGTAWYVLPPLGAVLAVLGVLIAISRVVTGVHYISDVLAGLAFGSVFAVLGWNAFVLAASALGFYAIMLL